MNFLWADWVLWGPVTVPFSLVLLDVWLVVSVCYWLFVGLLVLEDMLWAWAEMEECMGYCARGDQLYSNKLFIMFCLVLLAAGATCGAALTKGTTEWQQ